jgi:hypothetical protein
MDSPAHEGKSGRSPLTISQGRRLGSGSSRGVVLPEGLVLPAGIDPVLADLIGQVNSPDHGEWMGQVARVGGCAHPLHLRGFTRFRNPTTGAVDYEFSSREAPGGVILVRCRNRRASVCPSCAYLYQGDVYHLVRAGLEGGKGIPESVFGHPRVFATLTAPGFGAVHTIRGGGSTGEVLPCHPRRVADCVHGRVRACFARHGVDDLLLGTPLCGDCYDYRGAVVWQASVGNLWWRFCIYLRRQLGVLSGHTVAAVQRQVRLSYVKIVEYQRRGLVHVHAVIRADGITDEVDESGRPLIVSPPEWVSSDLLGRAVRAAAAAVRVSVDGGRSGSWVLGWGTQLDVHDITARAGQDAGKVAAYVAKYATKSTEVTGWDSTGRQETPRAVHTAAMAAAAFALAETPELAGLKLGRWVKELAYRGHVSSKSRQYSTTLGALRQARSEHNKEAAQAAAGRNGERVDLAGSEVESSWELVGFGYTPGQAMLAANVAKDIAVNREAAREAGAARAWVVVGGQAQGEDANASQRGARVASQRQVPVIGGDADGF